MRNLRNAFLLFLVAVLLAACGGAPSPEPVAEQVTSTPHSTQTLPPPTRTAVPTNSPAPTQAQPSPTATALPEETALPAGQALREPSPLYTKLDEAEMAEKLSSI